MKKGLFIALEGIDGSGKSIQAKLLGGFIGKEKGDNSVLVTNEHTDGLVGRLIDDVLNKKEELDSTALQVCFVADRVDHVNSLIKPALNQGKVVVNDRYYWSTAAYGYLSGREEMNRLLLINEKMCPKPDLFIFIDVKAEVALERMNIGRESLTIFEKKEKLKKVREAYKILVEDNKNMAVMVNGEKSVDEVHKEIVNILKERKLL